MAQHSARALAPAALVRALWPLCASFFLVFLGGGAFQQFVGPYLLKVHHLGAGASSLALATVYLVAFACLTFATVSLAWLGEYGALLVATLGYGVFALVALLTGNVVVLVLAAAVWGWSASVLWTAGTAYILDLADKDTYGRFSGTLYTTVFIGQALGVLLLGTLVDLVGPRGMAVGAVAFTCLGTISALFLPRRRRRAVPHLLNPFSVLTAAKTRTASSILLLSASGFGLLLGVFSQVVAAAYGLAAVGWITAGFYIARIPAGSGGGWLIDRWGWRPVLRVTFLCSSSALLLAALLHLPIVLAICAAALGVQAATVPVALSAWVGARASSEDRPSTIASIQLWSNMGTGLAILGGQQLLSVLGGWQHSFVVFAAVFLACAALASRLV